MKNLTKTHLLKKFLVSLIIFFGFQSNLHSQSVIEYYRSNSNGLLLVKILQAQTKSFKYVSQVDRTGDIILSKILFKEGKESKKWEYSYIDKTLSEEKYYKEKQIKEEYKYDNLGHKIRQTDYLTNNQAYKITVFSYNKDGLVDKEEIVNLLTNQATIVKYRYDINFRIKQIEKKYPDGRIVYWDAIFSQRGIIIQEYYTLNDEVFTFFYNESGQELKGEVKQKAKDGKEKIKIEWKNYYSYDGKKQRKEETNNLINKQTIVWYNKNSKEIKVETYYNNVTYSIEEYDYSDKNKVIYYKQILDLNLTEIYYLYDEEENLLQTRIYQEKKLKKHVIYNKDGSRRETIYSDNKTNITIEYDKDGKMVVR